MRIEQNPGPSLPLPTCDDRRLYDLWMSIYQFPALTVADELGIFPLLHKTAATITEIADRLSLKPQCCAALLAVLTSLGFAAQQANRFYLTEIGANYLLPESPYYWGNILHSNRGSIHRQMSTALQQSSSDCDASMTRDWKSGSLTVEMAERITATMHSHSLPSAVGLARQDHFTGVTHLLDVGGGSGCYSIALTLRHPQLHCTVLELPVVCPITRQYIAQYGLQDRIKTHTADMFADPWPENHDAILFSAVFHDWDRERCLQLSRNSFRTLPSGGRLYLHEILLDESGSGQLIPVLYSLAMTMLTEGGQLTGSKLQAMLSDCGFVDVKVTPSYGYYSLVSGRKP